jgi:hypothetical protein
MYIGLTACFVVSSEIEFGPFEGTNCQHNLNVEAVCFSGGVELFSNIPCS